MCEYTKVVKHITTINIEKGEKKIYHIDMETNQGQSLEASSIRATVWPCLFSIISPTFSHVWLVESYFRMVFSSVPEQIRDLPDPPNRKIMFPRLAALRPYLADGRGADILQVLVSRISVESRGMEEFPDHC